MSAGGRPRLDGRVRTSHANTMDRKLLAEIRDELVARPLGRDLTSEGEGRAREILLALDALNDRLDRMEQTVRLMARVTGVDPEALSDDELALLAETGAQA